MGPHTSTCGSVAVALAACLWSWPALAQQTPTPASAIPVTAAGVPIVGPLVGPPQVNWLSSQGDANGSAGDARVPSFVFDPIRLGLFGDAVPLGAADPACGGSIESTGSATASNGGFALQHSAALQLVPRLTLVGFSRGGCSLDAAGGGALVYATPIRKDIWFVASAGVLTVPHGGPNGTSVTRGHLRADVVFARPQGRSYSVGIGSRGLTFGGRL